MEDLEIGDCKIIEKAKELFLKLGFKSVTMDDIANEMGISKKTIYQSFKTKNKLVDASVDAIFQEVKSGIDKIRAEKYNPIEELYLINDYVLKSLNDEKAAPEHQLLKYYSDTHQRLSKLKVEAVTDCLLNNIAKGKVLGLYREDILDIFITAFYYVSITGIRNHDLFPLEAYEPKKINASYLEYHIRGIATQKGIEYLENLIKNRTI